MNRTDPDAASSPATWRRLAVVAVIVALAATAIVLGVVASRSLRARMGGISPIDGVEFGGCSAVVGGPICETAAGAPLRFWIPDAARLARIVFEADGAPVDAHAAGDVQGGRRFSVAVPPGTRELRIVSGTRVFRLAVRDALKVAWLDDAQALRDEGKLDEARAAIESHLPTASKDGRTFARARGLVARIHLAKGELEAAAAALREAIAIDRQNDALSAEADDSFALAFTLDQRLYRYGEARAVLDAIAGLLDAYPEGRARLPYYEGLVVGDAYELHAALVKHKEAQRRAERLGMTRLERNAESAYALVLAIMGRRADALVLLRKLGAETEGTPPCDRVDLLDAVGIWTLRSLDLGEPASSFATAPTARVAKDARTVDAGARARPLAASGDRDGSPSDVLSGGNADRDGSASDTPSGGKNELEALLPATLAPARADLVAAARAWTDAAELFPAACADVTRHAGVVLGLAEVALRRGELELTRRRLAEARATLSTPRSVMALAASSLEARLDLREGHPDRALAAYDAMARAFGATELPEWHYTIALGRGEAFEALGRPSDALASYEEADATVNDQSLVIPLTEGRAGFLADREKSARLRVDLLLRLGRPSESLALARASRATPLAAFQRAARVERLPSEPRKRWEQSIAAYRLLRDELERQAAEDWKWSAEHAAREEARRAETNAQLRAALDSAFATLAVHAAPTDPPPPPRAGELVIAYHPGREGWIGYGLSSEGLITFRFGEPPKGASAEDLSARLLAPLRAAIARAARIRVLAYGPFRGIDFHALPWDGGALLDRAAVAYGFDAPAPAAASPPTLGDEHASDGEKVALVVADARSDLPAAKREATQIAIDVASRPGWSVRFLANEDATSARVREGLSSASVFHYAGHGWFGGRAGMESALALADGGSLTVGDVLALPRVPAFVVLAGCETARFVDDAGVEGLGLAQAFVAAGSRGAIAPVRVVEDSLAARFSGALYASFASNDFDAALALRDAQRAVRETDPDADWAAFRLVVP